MGFSQEFLEFVVLGFKLSKLCGVGRLHAAKAGAPLVEGWLAKATGPAKFLDGHARVSLFEEANDLLIGEYCLLHVHHSSEVDGHCFIQLLLQAGDGLLETTISKKIYLSNF